MNKTISDDERAARMYANQPDHETGLERIWKRQDAAAETWAYNRKISEASKAKDFDQLAEWYGDRQSRPR